MENPIKEVIKKAKEDPELLNTLNVDELLESLESDKTDYLENKTLKSISEEVFEKLKELNCSPERLTELCEKLIGYRLVNEIYELHKGKLVKTINVENTGAEGYFPRIQMKGAVTNIKFLDNGTHVVCLILPNRYSQYKFDNVITFQQLSKEEQLILMAYDLIEKKT